MADLSVGLLTFENGAVALANQPKLSCTAANQLALEGSSLRLESGRELFFRDNGQVRCFDDHHRVVFNRQALSLELHEQGDICFLTGGPPPEERLRILANGNVGIGTTAPVAKLQVTGGAIMPAVGNTAQAGLQFPTNPGGGLGDEAFIRYFASVGETTKLLIGINNEADDTIGLQQMGAERLTISNGNVGIGTTTPLGRLHVTTLNDTNPPLTFAWDARHFVVGGEANIGGLGMSYDQTNGIGYIHALSPNVAWRNLVLQYDGGNVGIGTTTPVAKLQVVGGAIMPAIGNSPEAGIQFPLDPGGGAGDEAFIRYFAEPGTEKTKLLIGVGNDLTDDRFLDTIGFWQAGAERVTIAKGKLGIGTSTPQQTLHVDGEEVLSTGGAAGFKFRNRGSASSSDDWVWYSTGNLARFFRAGVGDLLSVTTSGNVGIGTLSPAGKLDVNGDIRAGNSDIYFTRTNHNHTGIGNTTGFAAIENAANFGALMILGRSTPGGRIVQLWDHVQVKNGNITVKGTIGTNGFPATPKKNGWGGGIRTWDVEAEGTIWSAHGMDTSPHDLAENYYSDQTLEPGDVVCLDRARDRIVMSTEPNDCLTLGIISTQPGLLLNADHEEERVGMVPVALSGRVPCKVTDENGPIQRGDLLTTSSTPGHAMKAKSVLVNGVEIYRPGTIIGKALEPHEWKGGVIETFVCLR